MVSFTVKEFNQRWKWTRINLESESSLEDLFLQFSELAIEDDKWIQTMHRDDSSYIRVLLNPSKGNVLFGSLMYAREEAKSTRKFKVFHYFVTENNLYTINLDLKSLHRVNEAKLEALLNSCTNAIEGSLLLVGEILDSFFDCLDDFERKLMELETEVHENNSTETLERIYERRYELLSWNNLLLPIKEYKLAIEEAFMDKADDGITEFRRLCIRVNRLSELLDNYKNEIDTLFRIDTSISTYRGNEIMKTLTVFTVIFTPLMALGALWGMNFKEMPELEWKYGYLYSLLLIGAFTLIVYLWLRYKGWTGDILKTRKRNSHLK